MSAMDRIKELTRPTGEEDLLPVRYPEPRVNVPVKQAAAAAGVVLVLVGGWVFTRGGPPDPPDDTVMWEQVANPTEVSGTVVVSVVGEVDNPGLVTLSEGSRVADALQIAKPRPHADLIVLNQAQLLVDGQQIHVQAVGAAPPVGAPAAGGVGGAGGAGAISLNSSGAAELTSLPGVGEATAAAIIAHREANGPFTSLEQLMDVKGIGPAKFEALRDLVAL